MSNRTILQTNQIKRAKASDRRFSAKVVPVQAMIVKLNLDAML